MTRVTDIEIERYLVDDLPAGERVRIEQAIKATPELAAHVEHRRAEQRAFFITHPQPQALPRSGLARLKAWLSDAPLRTSVATACAVGAVVLMVREQPPEHGVQTRGPGLAAHLVVRRGDQTFLHNAQPLRAGDQLRIEVAASHGTRCNVIGVDAHGGASAYYSEVNVEQGEFVFPDALVLDESEGPEDIVLVCGAGMPAAEMIAKHPTPFRVDELAARLKPATVIVLPIHKEPVER